MNLKPYKLVSVSMANGRYSIIGQVISLPIPGVESKSIVGRDATIMVRMIPDHPGSLEEVAISRLSIPAYRYRYVSYAKIRGIGQFPDDMLRYDAAVPVNFKVVDDLHRGPRAVLEPGMGDDLLIATVIQLQHRGDFCDARWASFLWSVERIGAPHAIKENGQ